ncbi:hypothetical protein SAMN05192558_104218 [Actinokineospora alba]|uniref:Uncharacterized protein n=1 Tax=Actinokineospora alba TaxID=504798 RepID=A0A1H0LPH9_9PSEU|nr:hypothetical protein SAMN05421871_10979 [Actinokineospora alba]SDO69770.1 hypothetical protein SAMN05192558_104218 [Actinokineospora alba]
MPTLLPGGRLVTDISARVDVEQAWGLKPGSLPAAPGRVTDGILAAAADGRLDGLVVGGVDPFDLADPTLTERALTAAGFVVSLKLRQFEALLAACDSTNPFEFALVAMLGLRGLRIFEACGSNVTDVGGEHSRPGLPQKPRQKFWRAFFASPGFRFSQTPANA